MSSLSYLRQNTKASDVKIRAVASLYQTVLEVERDGDRLQEEFAFYIGLDCRYTSASSTYPAQMQICWQLVASSKGSRVKLRLVRAPLNGR